MNDYPQLKVKNKLIYFIMFFLEIKIKFFKIIVRHFGHAWNICTNKERKLVSKRLEEKLENLNIFSYLLIFYFFLFKMCF